MDGIKADNVINYNEVERQIDQAIRYKNKDQLDSLTNLNSLILAYAKSTDAAKMSVEDFYATQVKSTTGVLGAIKAIKTYNNISEEDTATRKAYAQAVGNVNANLGKQMTNLNGANASIGTYAKSIASATLKTVSLNAATLALNAAFSFGLTAAVQGVINLAQKLWKLVPTANHVKEAAEKITEAYVSQTNASLGKYLNSVDTGAKVSLPRYIASLVKTRAAMMVGQASAMDAKIALTLDNLLIENLFIYFIISFR